MSNLNIWYKYTKYFRKVYSRHLIFYRLWQKSIKKNKYELFKFRASVEVREVKGVRGVIGVIGSYRVLRKLRS